MGSGGGLSVWKFAEKREDGGLWRWQAFLPRCRQKRKGGDLQRTSRVAEELCLAGISVIAKQRGGLLICILAF